MILKNSRHLLRDCVSVRTLRFSMNTLETNVVALFETLHLAFGELHGELFVSGQVEVDLIL